MEQHIKANKKDDILLKFERYLLYSKYKLVRNYVSEHPTAIIMTPEGYPCCIIEFSDKDLLGKDPEIIRIKKELKTKVDNAKARFAVITDGKNYKFLDRSKNPENKVFKPKQYDKIIEKIISENPIELISKYLQNNFGYFNDKENEPQFDNYYTTKQISLKQEQERKWIDELFKFQDFSGTVYRYTTLSSVFETLKNGNIRMNGIAGMNDISEVDYVEKMLYDGASPLDPEIDKVYIMSCSINKEDDLTQWRLYGDDGKGACLTFKVKDEEKNEDKDEEKEFIFQKIRYINDGGYYKPLKQLKELIKYVRQVTGYTFVFKSFHDWSHFIKPKDYEVESEARVLYHVKDKNENKHKPENWIFTNRNIANPYADIPLNEEEFPLELVEIKLGPKCPEFETNKSQLEALIKENDQIKNKKIIISKSKIEHYR